MTPTGDPYVDGVLSGVKWAVNSFTYSFPTSASDYGSNYGNGEPSDNFHAFNATQQAAVTTVLDMYSAVANVTFTEVAETTSTHADLRYASSDAPSTAWAYYPTTLAEGGDAWFNYSTGWYSNPVMGNYAWTSIIHETGHAMGLKHPHDTSGIFGPMPVDHDSLEYSVMSYRSYVGASTTTGYTNASDSFPQTLMMYDIAALQAEYGANYSTNSGDTVYTWNPLTGQESINGVAQTMPVGNKIFMTVWDGGGNDTYDFSNYTTNLNVDLQPGDWTTASQTQLAYLGSGHYAAGNIANSLLYQDNPASLIENAIGGSGSDTIVGNSADNHLTGGGGNDSLDGEGGTNTAVYSGASTDYLVVQNLDGTWTVTDLRLGSPDGIDTLANIQFLQFGDQVVAIGDVDPPANRAPAASNDTYQVTAGNALDVAASAGVLANDSDPDGDQLSAVLVSAPNHGSLTLNDDGSFDFTPTAGFTGTDSFTYQASDGTTDSGTATVTIDVQPPPNDPPVAVDDSYSTARGTKLTVTATDGVLANDSDANGDHLTAVLVSGPSRGQGSLTLNPDGSFVYTPGRRFAGTATFTYEVSDGHTYSSEATVTITVASSSGGGGGGHRGSRSGGGGGGGGGVLHGRVRLGHGSSVGDAHAPDMADDQLPAPAGNGWATRQPHWWSDAIDHQLVDLAGLPDHHPVFHGGLA